MRKTLTAAAMLAVLSVPAFAADLPLKAPPSNALDNWSASGWFVGLGTYGGVAQSSVNGTPLLVSSLASSNITASGGGIEGVFGYIHGNTNTLGFGNWFLLEGKGAYQNIQGGFQAPGGSAGFFSRWSTTQDACVGADVVAAITSVIGNFGVAWPTWTPALPANVAVGIPKQCFGVEAREFGLGGNFGGASGLTVGVAPGAITKFIYPTLTTGGTPNGGAIELWASVDWNTKGLTFNNVLGHGPVGVTGGVSEGTTYLAGVDILFAVKK
jgi:hypothetical protein